MYNGVANQGMRCIEDLIKKEGLEMDVFDVRQRSEFPTVRDYRLFICSGGPGDPHECLTHDWGKGWFRFLDELLVLNRADSEPLRHAFLICHSYQMACLAWNLADVTERQKPAFGIYPMNKTALGEHDPLFSGLENPFWVIDSREWQVVHPNRLAMDAFGAQVIAIERERPHVPLERAAMAIRFTPEIVGTQFHPEADDDSMSAYLNDVDALERLAGRHGVDRIDKIRESVGDPDKVHRTHEHVLPGFLRQALSTV